MQNVTLGCLKIQRILFFLAISTIEDYIQVIPIPEIVCVSNLHKAVLSCPISRRGIQQC